MFVAREEDWRKENSTRNPKETRASILVARKATGRLLHTVCVAHPNGCIQAKLLHEKQKQKQKGAWQTGRSESGTFRAEINQNGWTTFEFRIGSVERH